MGKEAHASAAPWEGLNALDALTISQVALALLRQQLAPGDQFSRLRQRRRVGANIIPSHVVGRFMARSVTERAPRHTARTRERLLRGRRPLPRDHGPHRRAGQRLFAHAERPGHPRPLPSRAESLGRSFEPDDAGVARPTISTDMANVSIAVPSIHPLPRYSHQRCREPSARVLSRLRHRGGRPSGARRRLALSLTAIGVARDPRAASTVTVALMIVEHALLPVIHGHEEAFEASMLEALPIITSAPNCHGLRCAARSRTVRFICYSLSGSRSTRTARFVVLNCSTSGRR